MRRPPRLESERPTTGRSWADSASPAQPLRASLSLAAFHVRFALSARRPRHRTLESVRSDSFSLWRRAPLAWALYDFAYSVFSFLLAVRFFPTWIINDLGRPDWYVSVTQFVVVLFVLVAMPLAGAVADQLGRRKPFLVVFTVLGSGACAALSVLPVGGSVLPVLVLAGVAVAFGQLAFAQYDPLLADVAPAGARGRVSGLRISRAFSASRRSSASPR